MRKIYFILSLVATLCLAGTNSFAALVNVTSPATAIIINEGDAVDFTVTLTPGAGYRLVNSDTFNFTPNDSSGLNVGTSTTTTTITHINPASPDTATFSAIYYVTAAQSSTKASFTASGYEKHGNNSALYFSLGPVYSPLITINDLAPTIGSATATVNGATLNFRAVATDPGVTAGYQTLSYAWYLDGAATPFSEVASGNLGLAAGSHTILLSVSDGYKESTESFTVNAVPIPSALWLLGSGLLGLIAVRRRKQKGLR